MWSFERAETDTAIGVTFTLTSPDGDEGYPGEVKVVASFLLTDDNELRADFKATTTKKTVINMTNHTYWNLSGDCKSKIYDQILQVNAETYLPVDDMVLWKNNYK